MAEITVLSEEAKKQRIQELLAELKELRATPRSDWHAAFEALLRIETYRFGDKVHIHTEEEIGEVPPRTDFVILVEDEAVDLGKAIYRIFRRVNILEYKNPHDALNERVIRKICGYANLYIGVAEHEGDVETDQVTISIFRAVKNPDLFAEMEEHGTLVRDDIPGIYHVQGITDLPFQIIITGELEGDEYAAYRALTDRAAEADVEYIIDATDNEENDRLREHYGVLLNLVMEKNEQYIELLRRDRNMRNVLLEIVQEDVARERQEEKQQTMVVSIRNLMINLKLTLDQAMDALSIPQSDRATYAGLVNNM